MLMGLVPVFAFRSLGTAGDFAILGDTVQSSGTGYTIDVNAVTPGGGAGAIGANTFNVDGGITTTVEGGIVSPLTDQLAAAQAAFTSFQNEANSTGTVVVDQLGGQILTPGVYRTAGTALITTANLTLDGPGDYLIYSNNGLLVDSGQGIALINGANAANVYLVFNSTVTINDAGTLNGNFLTTANLFFSSPSVVNGKLISLQTVTLEGSAGQTLTVNDFGAAPTITKSPDDGDNDLVVCVGDNLTYTLTADDPDPGTTELSLLSATPALPGTASHVPGLPTTGDPASTTFSFTPVLADVGTYTLVYRAEDQSAVAGTITERTITIQVVQAPVITLSNFAGQASGAGTPGDPYLLCPDVAFSYDFQATDGDGGDAITLSVAGAPASGVHAPALPTTQVSPINGTFDYTPTDAENGTTFTVTYSATDSFDCDAADVTVVFRVLDEPTFEEPTEIFQNVCVGDTLQYDIRVVDNDAGDSIQLSVEGTPVGAQHDPNLLGFDTSGPGGGDILVIGEPAITRFEWLPTIADVGQHILTYTAIDNDGCTETFTMAINVSQRPVFNTPPTPQDGEELEVCLGDTLNYSVSATDPDGDQVSLAATPLANLSYAPALPTSSTPSVLAAATFIPDAGQAGQTFSVIYTATDSFGCDETTEVRIRVTSPPVFNLPTVTTISACVGDELRIPVNASDVDGDEVVTLTSSALPGGATLEPALPATGNPVSTDIVWTPAAAGSSVITFTATDTRGCDTTQAVTINVSNLPTVSYTAPAGGQGGTGTVADPVRVCVGDTLTYTVNANSGDAGEEVTISATDVPTGLTHLPTLPAAGLVTSSTNASFAPAANQGGQTFTVTYTATDGSGAACTASTTLTIEVSNRPVFDLPTATTFNVCAGTPLTFEVRASDADTGDVVTLTAAGVPVGATMTPGLPVNGNPASSTFSWTPAAAGTSVVTFTATDASGCATMLVATVNVSAVPSLVVTAGAGASQGTGTLADPYVVCPAGTGPADTLTYSVTADDTDASELVTLAETGAPAGTHTPALPQTSAAPGAPATTAFSFTPSPGDSGQTFVITYTATDNSGAACSVTETVVIQVATLPEFDGGTPADGTVFNVCAGDPVTFRVHASDDDAGDQVTLSQSGGLSEFFTPSLPATGNPVETVFNWTPGAGAPSTSTLVFTATDTTGCSVTRTITINVSQIPTVVVGAGSGATSGTGTAADPYVVCPPGTAGADTLTFSVTADDTDAAQTVTLSETGSPTTGATYTPTLPASSVAPGDAVVSAFSYTPVAGDAGQTFTITYTATDDFTPACSATATVVIRVGNLPTFDGPTPADGTVFNVCAGDPVNFRVHATDADTSDVITLSHTGGLNAFFTPTLPATGNPVETVFNWTPGAGAPATSTLVFTATDTAGCATTRTITINVSQVPTVVVGAGSGATSGSGTAADPYVVCPPGTAGADTLTFSVTADDTDAAQTVTLSESGSPSGATYTPTLPSSSVAPGDAVVSAFSYTPVAGDAGQTFTITYTATDDFTPACTATATVVIRVGNLPTFDGPTPADGTVFNVCAGDPVNFRVHATDADTSDVITLSHTGGLNAFFTPTLPATGNPVETVFAWTPGAGAPATSTLVFTATDTAGCATTRTITINVSQVPTVAVTGASGASGSGTAADPYVVCPPGTSAADTLTYTVTADDADATQIVTLSEAGSPSAASYTPTLPASSVAPGDAVVSAFSYTPVAGDAGQTFTITYTATDDFTPACSATTTVVIRVSNLPQVTATPSVLNLCVGQNATFRVRATDADGGIVNLSQSNAPASVVFTPGLPLGGNPVETVATFTPTNADAGSRVVTFTATDEDGCAQTATVTLNVSRVPTVSVSGATGAVSGAGTAANPYVVCPPGTGPANTLTYNVAAADADVSQTVTLSQSGSPGSATYTPTLPRTGGVGAAVTTAFSYTAAAGDAGQTFTITYTATDSFSAACSSTATVVIRVAQLPQFDSPTPADGTVYNVCVGDPVTFRVRASDADAGEQVTLSQSGGLSGFFTPGLPLTGNPVETAFNWTPGAGAPATSTLVFTATDPAGCSVSRTITINVSRVPTVSVSGASGAIRGTGTAADPYVVCPPGTGAADTLTYNVSASDADATQTVTLSQSGSPSSATHMPTLPQTGATGATVNTVFSYTAATADAGQTFTVTYTATDNFSPACSASTTVVIRVARLPQFDAPTPGPGQVYNVCAGDPIRFRVKASDGDPGSNVRLTATGVPGAFSLTPTLPASGNPVETEFNWVAVGTGSHTLTFTATDNDGCAVTRTFTINVSAVPTLTVSGISGAQSGDGSEASPLVVCVSPASPLTFTVTGSDVDAADVLTLTQSGKPDGAVLTPNLPHVGTVGAPVSTQFTYSPGTADGGQNSAITFTVTDSSAAQCSVSRTIYVRVSHLPVATATPATITVCEGEEIRYRIRATDQDAGSVTIGTPTIAPAGLTLSHTVGLPAVGNPIETDAVATAPELPANTTFTITYPVTDADGCTTGVVVTVTVMDSEPSSISLSRTGTLAVGSEICYTAVVFDNCPPSEGGPRRVPGVSVVFRVTGETGNNELDNTTVITDANGEARLCLTPLFPGTLMVSAAIDLNGDGVGDTGTTGATDTVTIPAPTQDGPACFISGRGTVEVSEFRDRPSVVLGNFTVDVSPKRNGKLNGRVTFQIPSERFKVQSSKITSMGCSEGPSGKEVVIFGTARVQGIGLVQFRVDALDAGAPGAPGDRFVMTLMDGAGALHGPWGGNLEAGGRGRGNRGDISVRIGNLVR